MKSNTSFAIMVCVVIVVGAGLWYSNKSSVIVEVKFAGTLLSPDVPGQNYDAYSVKVTYVTQDTSDGYLSRIMNAGGSIEVILDRGGKGTINVGGLGSPVEVYGTFEKDGDLGIPFISLDGKAEYYLRTMVFS